MSHLPREKPSLIYTNLAVDGDIQKHCIIGHIRKAVEVQSSETNGERSLSTNEEMEETQAANALSSGLKEVLKKTTL